MRTCYFLLAAGLLDGLLTHFGMAKGIIGEANPLAHFLIEKSWALFYLVKISLPLLLIGIMLFRPLQGWIRNLLNASSVVYGSVLVYHGVWIFQYINSLV